MSLFKRRQRTATFDPKPEPVAESTPQAVDLDALRAEDDELAGQITSTADSRERASLLDRRADIHRQLGDLDGALALYEESLSTHEAFGPAYKNLLELYNIRLAQSASSGDGAGIQTWTTKIDDLTATSKRIMRSQY